MPKPYQIINVTSQWVNDSYATVNIEAVGWKCRQALQFLFEGSLRMDAAAAGIGGAIIFFQAVIAAVVGTCIALAVDKLTRA